MPSDKSHGRRLASGFLLFSAILFAVAVGALAPSAAATASALASEDLAQARSIGAEVDMRYRQLPGRRLEVTEATSMAVVETVTLASDWVAPPRVLTADNGIYFAICSAGATCPYPARRSAWPALALLPRRLALELALRTFRATSVSLVVVALPTGEPVWVVFERGDVLADVDARAMVDQALDASPTAGDATLRGLVDRLTRPRLFVPLPILPPPDHTVFAIRLLDPD
jgi:hypothetical protein